MQIHLIAVGDKMPRWVQDGFSAVCQTTAGRVCIAPDRGSRRQTAAKRRYPRIMRDEASACRGGAQGAIGWWRWRSAALSWSTEQLAGQLDTWMNSGHDLALLVGGPDGLTTRCAAAAQLWSLGPDLPHPLVRVLLAEQLYRAWSILRNHPITAPDRDSRPHVSVYCAALDCRAYRQAPREGSHDHDLHPNHRARAPRCCPRSASNSAPMPRLSTSVSTMTKVRPIMSSAWPLSKAAAVRQLSRHPGNFSAPTPRWSWTSGIPGSRQTATTRSTCCCNRRDAPNEVLTGVAVLADRPHYRLSPSRVIFRDISAREAAAYWETGEPVDKAGSYAVRARPQCSSSVSKAAIRASWGCRCSRP